MDGEEQGELGAERETKRERETMPHSKVLPNSFVPLSEYFATPSLFEISSLLPNFENRGSQSDVRLLIFFFSLSEECT